ncbi:MAG: pilus assembly protein PilM [Gammaproteobacteria bacterium]|nr:pilus assembly protein PilM [Gammaproteobacteria bacterium]NIR84562.1 pilus assembly protein PilM [Gammaproteobacteria bacterium]NIR90465.1 pilus assembly protein PilM [Gammaproteobacteria bacterium]NIU05613.1 pilus assembly protein PilM [Gammaproteobacteria bacterium]NIV52752.1 pilus assembly protein PilM [Gammaproteobacteria bacterium]
MSGVSQAVRRVYGPLARLTLRRNVNRQRYGPIGLELGHERLHMLQLESNHDRMRVRAAASLPYRTAREELISDPRSFSALVKSALARHPFAGRDVVTCMPPEQLKLSLLNYKAQAGFGESEAIMRQAMDRVEGPVDEWLMDYVPVSTRSEVDGERGALLALVRRADVFSYLNLLERAGLNVSALEIGPVAIRRLVAYMHSRETFDTVLVINFGREKTYLTVISGRRLILDREVNFGEGTITTSVADTLELSPASVRDLVYQYGLSVGGASDGDEDVVTPTEIARTMTEIVKPMLLELAEEVTKVLMYTASQTRGGSVDHVYLLGSIARWPGIETLINGMLSLPVRILNPVSAFDRDDEEELPRSEPVTGFAIAAGCALRGSLENG